MLRVLLALILLFTVFPALLIGALTGNFTLVARTELLIGATLVFLVSMALTKSLVRTRR